MTLPLEGVKMNPWKAITGLILLVAGIALFWNSYNQLLRCNSTGGQIATGISKFFGGNGIPACNDATVLQIVGIVAAIAGVVILILAATDKSK
jgi:hypothetical protein